MSTRVPITVAHGNGSLTHERSLKLLEWVHGLGLEIVKTESQGQ